MTNTIDLFLLNGCSHCETLKQELTLRQKKDPLPISSVYTVITEDNKFFVKDNPGLNPLLNNVESYPYMKITNTQGTTHLFGDESIAYVKYGKVQVLKGCPPRKLKPCVGDECHWWREHTQGGVTYGDCRVNTSDRQLTKLIDLMEVLVRSHVNTPRRMEENPQTQ